MTSRFSFYEIDGDATAGEGHTPNGGAVPSPGGFRRPPGSLWRWVLAFGAMAVTACKTPQPRNDEAIFVNPTGMEADSEVPRSVVAKTPAQSAILAEPVRPVRGGPKMLPAYHGPDPCKMALVGESPVAKSCSEGGIRKATEMMQSFVKRAKAEGLTFACIDCHPDEDDFSKLAPGVDIEFRKLLFLARPE